MIRFFDVVFSLMGLIIAAPLITILFLFGLMDTGAPIFLQTRVGKNQKAFTLLKFRTMKTGTPSTASHLANPSAVTPLGKILRKTKLDELPQLVNVLKGDMSLVGPRPGLYNQIELTKARNRLGIYTVRPGITGLAQIKGIDMSNPELLAKVDAKMISSLSTQKYFRYILMTLAGNGRGDRINGL